MEIDLEAVRVVFEDGKVTSLEMEAAGKFEVSSAEACLIGLKK